MRNLILIILIFTLNFSYSQTEKDDYEIYSMIINERLENLFENQVKSIIIIEKFKNEDKQDLNLILELTKDSIPAYASNWLIRDTIQNRITFDFDLKKVLFDLITDFSNHPKIKTSELKLRETEIQTIQSDRFYSYFGKKSNRVKNGWQKINRKYRTDLVFQLSKIKYYQKYATFYISHQCGELCGSGEIILMEKINGKWKELTEFNLWMS